MALENDIREIVKSELSDFAKVISELVKQRLEESGEQLVPLYKIMNCAQSRANKIARENAGLYALGIWVGKRKRLYRASEVIRYMRDNPIRGAK